MLFCSLNQAKEEEHFTILDFMNAYYYLYEMFYIYIIDSSTADKYYVGHTNDIDRRLKEHNEDKHFNTYTSKHRPWKAVALFKCGNERSTAMKLEGFIKKQHNRNLILKLINPDFKLSGKLAQLVRVPHVRD